MSLRVRSVMISRLQEIDAGVSHEVDDAVLEAQPPRPQPGSQIFERLGLADPLERVGHHIEDDVERPDSDLPVEIRMLSGKGEIKVIGNDILVKKQSVGESVFFLLLDKNDVRSDKTGVTFGIFSRDKLIEDIRSTFVGPSAP